MPGFETNNINPQWGDSRTIYFSSSVSGEHNLYKIKIAEDGKATLKPEQLTNFKDYSIRYFGVSADGTTIVFERDKNIYLMKTSGGSPQKVDVQISADDRFDPIEFKTFTNNADYYSVSPNGKLIAFVMRGEVFVKEADKEKAEV